MKKIFCIILIIIYLFSSITVSTIAFSEKKHCDDCSCGNIQPEQNILIKSKKGLFILDDADLFTREEENQLQTNAQILLEKYNFHFILHTVTSADAFNNKSIEGYANAVYSYGEYNKNGLLFLFCKETKEYYVLCKGDAIQIFDETRLNFIYSSIKTDIKENNYYDIFQKIEFFIFNYTNAYYTNTLFIAINLNEETTFMYEVIAITIALFIFLIFIIIKQINFDKSTLKKKGND